MVCMLIVKSYSQTYDSYLALSGIQPSTKITVFGPESLIWVMLFEGEIRRMQ